jgi:hypothetical protein
MLRLYVHVISIELDIRRYAILFWSEKFEYTKGIMKKINNEQNVYLWTDVEVG